MSDQIKPALVNIRHLKKNKKKADPKLLNTIV